MPFFFIRLSGSPPAISDAIKNPFADKKTFKTRPIKGTWQGIMCTDEESALIRKGDKMLLFIQEPVGANSYPLNPFIFSNLRSREGAFLLIQVDSREPSVQLAGDRFGGIGCYLYHDEENFILSSHLKPLLKALNKKTQISLPRLAGFLCSGLPPYYGDDTLFERISRPAPGFLHRFDLRNSDHNRHSYLTGTKPRPLWEPALPSRLGHASSVLITVLNRAVRANLPNSGQAALELSGGIDSSILAAELKKIGVGFTAFSVTYPCCNGKPPDESAKVRLTARSLGIPIKFLRVRGEEVLELTDRLTSLYAEPLSSPGMAVSWILERSVKDAGFDACFSGLAGDMLLGGLPALFLGAVLGKKPALAFKEWRHWRESIPLSGLLSGAGTFLSPGLRRIIKRRRDKALSTAPWLRIEPRLPAWYESDAPAYPEFRLDHEQEEILPKLLGWQRLRSDALGVEVRTPYAFTPAISELQQIPASFMVHAGYNKFLARLAYRDALPGQILWDRVKLGFETPLDYWVSGWNRELKESFFDSSAMAEILDPDWVERHWEGLSPVFCWRLFAAARFCQVFEHHLP